ncbi:MAG: glycosyltransferase [Muribaculaceae bacterium]|nr:glycosyltransferase [Muribaculaceae bacterium]
MDNKVIFLSRSDLRGGAAIVTYRLMLAMRDIGVDARMLVCEKLSDSPYVDYCVPKWRIQYSFLKERLEVFIRNGLDRSTLFKVDPATEGLPVWKHPWVREADSIYLGWVNQGMLSLQGVKKLSELMKPMVWVMHDMWNMTGICHHAGKCRGYMNECGDCPLLGKRCGANDMSHKTWCRKMKLYREADLRFVAVSSWLARKAEESSLLNGWDVTVIPNPFPISDSEGYIRKSKGSGDPVRIIFGAARLDDPIKGLPVLKEALSVIMEKYPEEGENMEMVTFGTFKNPENRDGFTLPHRHLGALSGEEAIREAYKECDIVVSASDFESFGATLVEGQAYGCIPVGFDHGGQRDIIDHMMTGYLADWDDEPSARARMLAEGIVWAYRNVGDTAMIKRMRESVVEKFSASEVAHRILAFTFTDRK